MFKRVKNKKYFYFIVLTILIVIIFIYKYYMNIDINRLKKQNEKYIEIISDNNIIENNEIMTTLEEQFENSDIVGTIKIDGTDIDTMLVQTTDNEYYLNHSYDKSDNSMGAIFIDYRNNLNDKKILLYGHNFRYKKGGFHELTKYASKKFYSEYPYINIVLNNEQKKYIIFSVMIEKSEKYPHTIVNFNSEQKYYEHLNWLKSKSIYDTNIKINSSDNIITLQTCYYDPDGSYLIISAKQI